MKINRLFEIVYMLLDKDKMTARELADRFEVSTRTIYRDVEDLSAAGIPIYMSKGRNGGISLLSDYVLNKTLLTEKEKIHILSALQGFNALDELSVEDTLSKLSAFFGDKDQGIYEIDFDDWGNLIKDQFDKSKQAIMSKKLLSFDYLSSLNMRSKRMVEPYKLWFKDKNWYLKAFCLDKKAMRTFRFSRMRKVEILDKSFEPRMIEFSETNDEKHSFKMIEIVLRIEKEMEYRVLDEFSDSNVAINEDGSFIVTMKSIEDDWLYGYILSFGSSAMVLSPLKLRKAMATMIGEMSSNYSKQID
ncbi:MAG TPA: YafY family transcriptional regulator [Tissierellia bacterium]|jgi:predicted DNA-binding transcriptional regulator YafY|nr:YafY family transcriptional regulator [Tissierellia bacterium]